MKLELNSSKAKDVATECKLVAFGVRLLSLNDTSELVIGV